MRIRTNSLMFKEHLAGYLFALPWFVGFIGLTLGPIIASFYLSLTRYEVLTPPRFVGTRNYAMMVEDPQFWQALYNTGYMVLFGVPAGILVALTIALLLNHEIKGIALYRAVYYLPAIMPVVASSILWLWVFNADRGILNSALSFVGIRGPNWLTSPVWSKPAIVIMNTWAAGSTMIIFLAGLKGIPDQLYEAAEIDGASMWHRFFNITLPMLSPTIFFVTLMGIISTFQIFTQAYIMTRGGPLDSTLFYVYYLYNNAFAYFRMGYASALAWILFLVILAVTLIMLRTASHWVYYEGKR